MRKLTFSVLADGELLAKFYLQTDAEIFVERLLEITTNKRIVIETKDRLIVRAGA